MPSPGRTSIAQLAGGGRSCFGSFGSGSRARFFMGWRAAASEWVRPWVCGIHVIEGTAKTPRRVRVVSSAAAQTPNQFDRFRRISLKNSNFRLDHNSPRPLAIPMEISLGAQRSDRSFCVRPSLRPCCGNDPWRQHYARGNGIFAAPQFPTFSTQSTYSGCCACGREWRKWSSKRALPLRAVSALSGH